jgi:hypothetical protein
MPAVEWEYAVNSYRARVSGMPFSGREPLQAEHSVSLRVSGFAWEAIEQESERQGVSVEDLVAFAVMYYLADADSGRIARQVSRSPYADPAVSPDTASPDPQPPSNTSP